MYDWMFSASTGVLNKSRRLSSIPHQCQSVWTFWDKTVGDVLEDDQVCRDHALMLACRLVVTAAHEQQDLQQAAAALRQAAELLGLQ